MDIDKVELPENHPWAVKQQASLISLLLTFQCVQQGFGVLFLLSAPGHLLNHGSSWRDCIVLCPRDCWMSHPFLLIANQALVAPPNCSESINHKDHLNE